MVGLPQRPQLFLVHVAEAVPPNVDAQLTLPSFRDAPIASRVLQTHTQIVKPKACMLRQLRQYIENEMTPVHSHSQ
jgi:hypothetical protein